MHLYFGSRYWIVTHCLASYTVSGSTRNPWGPTAPGDCLTRYQEYSGRHEGPCLFFRIVPRSEAQIRSSLIYAWARARDVEKQRRPAWSIPSLFDFLLQTLAVSKKVWVTKLYRGQCAWRRKNPQALHHWNNRLCYRPPLIFIGPKTNIIPSTHIRITVLGWYSTRIKMAVWSLYLHNRNMKIPTRTCCVCASSRPSKVYIHHMGRRPNNTLTNIHRVVVVWLSRWPLSRYYGMSPYVKHLAWQTSKHATLTTSVHGPRGIFNTSFGEILCLGAFPTVRKNIAQR